MGGPCVVVQRCAVCEADAASWIMSKRHFLGNDHYPIGLCDLKAFTCIWGIHLRGTEVQFIIMVGVLIDWLFAY